MYLRDDVDLLEYMKFLTSVCAVSTVSFRNQSEAATEQSIFMGSLLFHKCVSVSLLLFVESYYFASGCKFVL